MTAASPPALGRIGRYELLARLGGGGMAEVFRARIVGAEGFSRTVAIKRVLPGFSGNPAFAEMFVTEGQVCARMQHPNVVSVVDFDRDHEQRLFLVMELVDGTDLDGLIASGPLPAWAAIYIVTEVLRGLGYAHDLPAGGVDPTGREVRGVVHRDVSPHNVLVSWEGAVKVSDFGIAKARAQSVATASVLIKGKPAYMSPEQANGAPIDGRSDLFAVGIILWEILTGERLFVGDTREALAQLFFKPIPPPSTIRPTPPDLEAIALHLLERDADARYRRAEDAIDDLARCADAPRDGRSELVRLLAERFAQAPRTTRTGRPTGSGPPGQRPGTGPAMSTRPAPAAATPLGAAAPGAPPIVVAGPTAPTIAAPASPASAPRRWPVVVAVATLAVVAATVVVVASGGGAATPAPAPDPAAAGATDARPVDVDAPVAPVAPVLDAAPPDAAPGRRRRDPRPRRDDRGIQEVDLGR